MTLRSRQFSPSRRRGMSLMECLVLVLILGIVGAGAGRSLISLAKTPTETDVQFQIETAMVSKMEALRAMPFDSLLIGSPNMALSDTVTINGKTYWRYVIIGNSDGDGNGVPDATLKLLYVWVDNRSISTLVSR